MNVDDGWLFGVRLLVLSETQPFFQMSTQLGMMWPFPVRYFDAIWALPSGGLYRDQEDWYEMATPTLGL